MGQADSSSSQLQPNAASSALQQLADWQAQHRDHMRADVMQVMEESSDDESTLAEGSQVNMTANASSFGTLDFGDQPIHSKSSMHQDAKSQQQAEPARAEKHRGLVSFIKGALRRR